MKSNKSEKMLASILQTNLLPLAFIGDSVHTLFVREKVLESRDHKMDNYHTNASKFCKASSQAKVLKEIMPSLTQIEQEIVRRGRNAKPKHSAKNASSADYSYATAFEILIGYLYLNGEDERLNQILNLSINIFKEEKC